MKKYEFTGETKTLSNGVILHRIKALVKIELGALSVNAGDLGGWIEKESNLSQEGSSWVFCNARVFDGAWVYGDSQVFGNARVCDDARVFGNSVETRPEIDHDQF